MKDPIRPWFKALEGLGEYIGIRFGKVNPETNEVEWIFLPHTEYDGIGAFAHLMREGGVKMNQLPQITHPAPLNWTSFLRLVPRMMGPRRRLKWKPLPQGPALDNAQQPPPAVAWHVFTEEDSAKLRRASRLANVSVNSLLLKYLDRAVRADLENPSSAIPWMIPVNMRGKVTQDSDVANHASYIGIRIFASESVKDVHRHIYDALGKGQHCGNWKALNATGWTSEATKQKMLNMDRATLQWSLGGFSNLGVWDREKAITAETCQGPWLFSPPVLSSQLVGAGCITFQGRLSLTLQIHPDLTTSPEVAAKWMRTWVREIEFDFPAFWPAENATAVPTQGHIHSFPGALPASSARTGS
ncbi:hypothetical protein KBB96_11345 [Luteolibacter ambystomatis]|uniref:Uncharacterized protein n=1 Tax=Luteolibacter ambystomatis TaxID=2824561 RepID=A0A975G532_9BACT|nr:hypothetical protein [Luteolibacter ambystomatis]QUE49467.1 hypothetical protein KBB96_11345 [Luteolibacter ambystomatis]